MTYREKTEVLQGYICAQRRIVSLTRELEQWRTIGTSITQKISPVIVNTNENNSKVERCAIKCAEIEQEIVEELAQAEIERNHVKHIIDRVKDSRKRELLTMRYISNIPVRKIAILCDANEGSIHKQLRRTITKLEL